MASRETTYADLFPPASEAAWRALVERVLKGQPFEKLVATTPEGVRIQPLYPRAAAEGSRALRRRSGAWQISQRMDHPDPGEANTMALGDLANGADALTLVVAGAAGGRGFGVAIDGGRELAAALAGVELDLIGLRLDAGRRSLEVAGHLAELAKQRRLTAAALDIDVGHDPIGDFARSGTPAGSAAEMGRKAVEAAKTLRAAGFAGHTLLADGRHYHEAGAGEAQELAAVLATGVAYLRLLEVGGLSLEEARAEIAFLLVADADAFLSLAKFRALRRLWARVEGACGLANQPLRLHAETAWRMMTRRDPWVNILRSTLAVFAAGLGGADAIGVLPFTLALGLPDDLARRIARNSQLILLEESHLGVVADPAAGAGGFEALTEALCEKAWLLFQDMERAGGIVPALAAGELQTRIAETAAARSAAVAQRSMPITGTSEFPNLSEAPVAVLAPTPAPASVGRSSATPAGLLVSHRDAELFEAMRDRADAYRAAQGTNPRVFLANLGPVAAFSARATFAANFFAAAGLEAVSTAGFTTALDAAQAFKASGAAIACLCSSDTLYADLAIATVQALANGGAAGIYLAGKPSEDETDLRTAGVRGFVFANCDALATLEDALPIAISVQT